MRTHAKTWGTLIAITTLAMIFTPELSLESLDLGVTLLVYLAIAQAWNVLAGFGGQVSLGSAAFVATGGYASGAPARSHQRQLGRGAHRVGPDECSPRCDPRGAASPSAR